MTTSTSSSVAERIDDLLAKHDILLFMKGVPAAPQCGFSQAVVQIMGQLGVRYAAVNVLADDDIREGIKAHANWPTIPQLYVKGEFIGGCDIVRELFASGELRQLIADQGLG